MPLYLNRISHRSSFGHFVGACAMAFVALGSFIAFSRCLALGRFARTARRTLFERGLSVAVCALVLVGCGHESKPLSPSERIRAESVEVTELPQGAEFYLADAQESPLAVVKANGTVRSRAVYHAYGQVRHQAGSGDAFGFLRNEEDRGAGLSDFGARPYRPELGVFLAPDPVGLFEPEKVIGKPTVGQGYAYASGDPINTIDRDGRCGTPYAVTGMGCEKNYGPQLPEAAQKAVDEGATHAPEHVFTFLAIVDGVGVVAAGARFLAVAVTRKLLGVALKEGAEAIAETAVSMAAKSGVEGAVESAAAKGTPEYVNLASAERTQHILYGDKTGGGHLFPGEAGKSSFPQDWSADRVMHEISDVATDPALKWFSGRGGRSLVEGTRDGIDMTVVLESSEKGGGIVTGFPTNVPRNP